MTRNLFIGLIILGLIIAALFAVTSVDGEDQLTLYSGRGESMVSPIINQFEQQTGIQVNVRYGGTSQLAVLLQEEGERTPADLFWGQDAGAMGALSQAGLLRKLPENLYDDLPSIYTSETGQWVAASGRARVYVYSPGRVSDDEHPESVFDLTDPRYEGRVGWAPNNGSFQSFVTAMRHEHGDERTLEWLRAMKANGAQNFRNNSTQVEGVADGSIDFGLVNNYYLPRFKANDSDFPAEQAFFTDGDIGNLVNVAGIGVLRHSERGEAAETFIRFLLSEQAQQYFTSTVYEYPVRQGIPRHEQLESFDRLLEVAPEINLDQLTDLEGTLNLLRRADLI